jgi:Zn-dependent peptidase ImmA (M78 family)
VTSQPDFVSRMQVLSRRAGELTSELTVFPVQVRPICTSLGVRVVRRASVPKGKAYLAWDNGPKRKALVLLPTESVLEWDRFCTAHELGHFILASEFNEPPYDTKEYWKAEFLCDEFARQLLTPELLVETWLGLFPVTTLADYFTVCDGLAREAKVPWVQAAKRIHTTTPGLAFFRIIKNEDGDFVIRHSSFTEDRGKFTKFKRDTDGWTVLQSQLQRAHEQFSSNRQYIEPSKFRRCSFSKLISAIGIDELVAESAPQADVIKIVARYTGQVS